MNNFDEILWNMKLALEEAEKAFLNDEVPVGSLIVNSQGEVLSKSSNSKELDLDVTSHAEINAIKIASKKINSWRLTDCTLYTTLEPCVMCMSAISQSRVKKVIFGAYDKKGGALSLGYNIHNDERLNHRFEVYGGVLHYESSSILSKFFRQKRKFHD